MAKIRRIRYKFAATDNRNHFGCLGTVRFPRTESYTPLFYGIRGRRRYGHQAFVLKTHKGLTKVSVPGYVRDPRNKTLLTKAMIRRRFEKWLDTGKPWDLTARRAYWRRQEVMKRRASGLIPT